MLSAKYANFYLRLTVCSPRRTPYVFPCVAQVAPDEYDTPLLRFLRMPPKSNFKSIFLTTSLRQKLIRMSLAKAVPEGLKDQDSEKGSRAKHPPIPYVPVIEPVKTLLMPKNAR